MLSVAIAPAIILGTFLASLLIISTTVFLIVRRKRLNEDKRLDNLKKQCVPNKSAGDCEIEMTNVDSKDVELDEAGDASNGMCKKMAANNNAASKKLSIGFDVSLNLTRNNLVAWPLLPGYKVLGTAKVDSAGEVRYVDRLFDFDTVFDIDKQVAISLMDTASVTLHLLSDNENVGAEIEAPTMDDSSDQSMLTVQLQMLPGGAVRIRNFSHKRSEICVAKVSLENYEGEEIVSKEHAEVFDFTADSLYTYRLTAQIN